MYGRAKMLATRAKTLEARWRKNVGGASKKVDYLINNFKDFLIIIFVRRAEQLSLMMSQESIPSFVFHLVQMLSNWVTWFPYDFQV